MSIIATKAKELKKLVKNQTRFAAKIVKSEPEFIEDLNMFQLQKGIDGEGDKITPPYTPFTKRAKRSKGQPTDRVTLYDEGDFYKSIESRVSRDNFALTATDIKTESLKDKYGEDIIGLNQNSITKLINDLLIPELRVINKKKLNG